MRVFNEEHAVNLHSCWTQDLSTLSERYTQMETGAYTWWSYMFNARANNAGWRIDYFVLSERMRPYLKRQHHLC